MARRFTLPKRELFVKRLMLLNECKDKYHCDITLRTERLLNKLLLFVVPLAYLEAN